MVETTDCGKRALVGNSFTMVYMLLGNNIRRPGSETDFSHKANPRIARTIYRVNAHLRTFLLTATANSPIVFPVI